MIYIYTLEDPDGNIRYAGQTQNIRERYSAHCRLSKLRENTHKNNWIKGLLKNGHKPIINVLEEVVDTEGDSTEIYWIAQLKAWGFALTNGTDGGSTGVHNRKGCKLTEAHKKKISKSSKGHKKPDGFKEKITGANNHFFGKKHSEETRHKLSEIAKQNMTEERKIKISKSVKKAMKNPELKKHISKELSKKMKGEGNPMYGKKGEDNPNFGRKNTEKTKNKMSKSAKKRWRNKKDNH